MVDLVGLDCQFPRQFHGFTVEQGAEQGAEFLIQIPLFKEGLEEDQMRLTLLEDLEAAALEIPVELE